MAGRSRSGASASTCAAGPTRLAAEGLSLDWYVHRHRTEGEVLPWDHLTAGLHKDFLWDDWRAALAGSGIEDCRWTPCYDCGVCTGYGIEHVVASPVAAGRWQPGNRSGSGPWWRGARADPRWPMRLRMRYAKLGKVRFTSHRDTARDLGAGAAPGSACRWRRAAGSRRGHG